MQWNYTLELQLSQYPSQIGMISRFNFTMDKIQLHTICLGWSFLVYTSSKSHWGNFRKSFLLRRGMRVSGSEPTDLSGVCGINMVSFPSVCNSMSLVVNCTLFLVTRSAFSIVINSSLSSRADSGVPSSVFLSFDSSEGVLQNCWTLHTGRPK